MSPAAIAIPRFTANAAPSSGSAFSKEYFLSSHGDSGDWNNMDNALDFDLLAEYLLEDGMSGFDFVPGAASPVNENLSQAQSSSQQLAPGVVTPHQADVSFADPLADAVEQLNQHGGAVLPSTGVFAGEFAQARQRAANQVNTIPPQQPRSLPTTEPVIRIGQPMMMMPHLSPSPAKAPTLQQTPLPNALPIPSNKRPRVDVKGGGPAPGPGPSMVSFAAVNGSNVGAPLMSQASKLTLPGSFAAQQSSLRQKSQAQVDRRRERNRILARRTRLRKKFFFESLQKDVADLQRENAALKSIVRSRLTPEDAKAILSTCDANEKLPSIIHDPVDENGMGFGSGADGDVKQLDKEDFSLIQSIQNSQQCFVITDPSLHDNPIVYASDDFLNLTGYSQEEVLGRNCRFLQGVGTCSEKIAIVRKAVTAGEDVNVTLVNYTSDGTPFWNSLFIAALRDADNNIVNFIGVIVKVAGPEPGDKEYGRVLKADKL